MASLSGVRDNDMESPTPGIPHSESWFHKLTKGIEGTTPNLSLPKNSALREKLLDINEAEFTDGETVSVTLQIEMFTIITGLAKQVVSLTSTVV